MAQNPSFPGVRSQSLPAQEDRNESPQRQRLQAVFLAFQESGAGSNLALDILLHELAEESLFVPGVTGAAIALRGAGDQLVCRAVAGEPTPAMGARIEAHDGLSAECVRTGRLQVCQDTESDARLDPEICRAWGVRSLAIVPLFLRQRLVGILEVFSPVPDAFDRAAMERLVQLGGYVVETVAFSEGPIRPEEEVRTRPSSARPRAETWIDTQLPEMTPVAVHAEPVVAQARQVSAARLPVSSPAVSSAPAALTPPRPVISSVLPAVVPPAGNSLFAAPGVLAPAPGRRNLALALVVLAAGFIAVASLWVWWPAAENRTAVSAAVIPVPRVDPAAPANGLSGGDRVTLSRGAKPSPASKSPLSTVSKSASDSSARSGGLVVYENGKVVYRAVPGSGSMIGPTSVDAGAPRSAATGPVTSAAETEKLKDTAAGGTITGGKLIREVDPVLPPDLAGVNLPEEVLLEGVIDRDGSVRDLHLLRGDTRLADAAIEAARQWRYEPFRSNGERVDMLATLSVRFR